MTTTDTGPGHNAEQIRTNRLKSPDPREGIADDAAEGDAVWARLCLTVDELTECALTDLTVLAQVRCKGRRT
ncbi:hypothetical protein [Frankia nepalensis]|uniref:Uncharacterized protein n=2 Tax=Frankia nepalensis TaxID=1836974 RepID=A0A937RK33_9ACTN|nr:hypothetical protein [Frankia nepalensis]MBL7509046.1 hypothetical protein [Frankia nepalensis]MBL7627848.1 hypothetical protein [Frankia nepalensis]